MNKTSMRIAVTAAAVTVVLVTWIQSGTCLSVLVWRSPAREAAWGFSGSLWGERVTDGMDDRHR